jgi:hypothetical protein
VGPVLNKGAVEMAVFWDAAQYRIYQITRCYIPEDSHLHTLRREDLQSHKEAIISQILI